MKFIAAWRFLTIIPILRLRENSEVEISRSVIYFPVVGIAIGLILALLAWILNLFLPQMLLDVLLVIAMVVVTGAIHVDGLADTCDGLGGRSIAERQEIMHDSRHGTFGVIAIISLLLIKFTAFINLSQSWLLPALIVVPMIGRWAIVYCITFYPYARTPGTGTLFKKSVNKGIFLIDTFITLIVSILLFQWASLVFITVAFVIMAIVARAFNKFFSGLNGDNYGAINEIIEVSTLIIIVILSNKHWLLIQKWLW